MAMIVNINPASITQNLIVAFLSIFLYINPPASNIPPHTTSNIASLPASAMAFPARHPPIASIAIIAKKNVPNAVINPNVASQSIYLNINPPAINNAPHTVIINAAFFAPRIALRNPRLNNKNTNPIANKNEPSPTTNPIAAEKSTNLNNVLPAISIAPHNATSNAASLTPFIEFLNPRLNNLNIPPIVNKNTESVAVNINRFFGLTSVINIDAAISINPQRITIFVNVLIVFVASLILSASNSSNLCNTSFIPVAMPFNALIECSTLFAAKFILPSCSIDSNNVLNDSIFLSAPVIDIFCNLSYDLAKLSIICGKSSLIVCFVVFDIKSMLLNCVTIFFINDTFTANNDSFIMFFINSVPAGIPSNKPYIGNNTSLFNAFRNSDIDGIFISPDSVNLENSTNDSLIASTKECMLYSIVIISSISYSANDVIVPINPLNARTDFCILSIFDVASFNSLSNFFIKLMNLLHMIYFIKSRLSSISACFSGFNSPSAVIVSKKLFTAIKDLVIDGSPNSFDVFLRSFVSSTISFTI